MKLLARLAALLALCATMCLAQCPYTGIPTRWSTSPPANSGSPTGDVVINSVILLDRSVTVNSIVVASGGSCSCLREHCYFCFCFFLVPVARLPVTTLVGWLIIICAHTAVCM